MDEEVRVWGRKRRIVLDREGSDSPYVPVGAGWKNSFNTCTLYIGLMFEWSVYTHVMTG